MRRALAPYCRLAVGLLVAACSEGTGPGSEPALLVLPAIDTLPADSSVQLRAVQVRADGDTVDVQGAVWSSRDPDVAPVSSSGLVTGVRSGQVTIVALAGDLRGTADVRVERRFQALAVSTGSISICAVDLDGRIWCQGGLGTGIAFPSSDATELRTFLEPVHGTDRYTAVGSNLYFACGLATGGQVLCWGYQPLGDQLSAGVPTAIAPGITFETLSVQGWMGCGLADQTAYCWGVPVTGVTPINTNGFSSLVQVYVQQYDACGRTTQGDQLCWDGSGLAFADGRTILPPPPTGAPALHDIVNGGSYFCGLDAAGQGWCWGANESGQLGNGTAVNSSDAVQVAGGRHFTLLSAPLDGGGRVCGIAERSELLCWGTGFGPVPAAVLY